MAVTEWNYGADGKIYYGAVDTALGALTELDIVKDVTVSMEKAEVAATTRRNGRKACTKPGHMTIGVEFEMDFQPADAGFQAMRDAFLNDTPIRVAALSGDRSVSGSQGPMAEFHVMTFPINQPMEDGQSVSVKLAMDTFVEYVEI
jgi:hypothetical protein